MTKIYVVRHCEAEGNVSRMFQGLTNLDITELGAKQLEALSKRFEDIHIDRVLSSPLTRAIKTGRAVIGNKNITLETDDELIELNGGVIEGKTYTQIYKEFPDFEEMWANHSQDFAPQDGETMKDAYTRISNAFFRIAKENKGKTVALSTHGGVIRCLLSRLLFNDINRINELNFSGNTAITLVEVDDDLSYTVKFYNNTDHLSDDLINQNALIPIK